MRTTVTLEPEVAAAAQRLRPQHAGSLSASVNALAKAGIASLGDRPEQPFVQQTTQLGLRIDVSNVAEALDLLDGPGKA